MDAAMLHSAAVGWQVNYAAEVPLVEVPRLGVPWVPLVPRVEVPRVEHQLVEVDVEAREVEGLEGLCTGLFSPRIVAARILDDGKGSRIGRGNNNRNNRERRSKRSLTRNT